VGGTWGECQGSKLPASEQCDDGRDDDCNGAIDEGCPCETGDVRDCYGGPAAVRGIGVCVDGTQRCVAAVWAADCEGDVLPTAEDPCNSVDDDCDGIVATDPGGTACCVASCAGKLCGTIDGCGGTCTSGSGCCTPECTGKLCGESDGCGGSCEAGSGCCAPSCAGKSCGESDGCTTTTCTGSCPFGYQCTAAHQCECGPSPHFLQVGGDCLPSCGVLLGSLSLPNVGNGCCAYGCLPGTFGGGPGSTHDCEYCCSTTAPGDGSCVLY
jgi:hypothetical protein